jgi:hypothetical protein
VAGANERTLTVKDDRTAALTCEDGNGKTDFEKRIPSLCYPGERSRAGGFRAGRVQCPCGHTELLTAGMLATAGVSPDQKVLGLSGRLRCRECDERGRAVVSIKSESTRARNQIAGTILT